jgi:hypothetical protein
MNWPDTIERHYKAVWKQDGTVCPFTTGPIDKLPPEFCVLEFPPSGDGRSVWTHATRCMSNMIEKFRVDLHMFSNIESVKLVELLYAVSFSIKVEGTSASGIPRTSANTGFVIRNVLAG